MAVRRVTFEVGLFRTEQDRARSERVLLGLLSLLVVINESWLRAHPRAPKLYESGVRYRRERPGREDWLTVPSILERGHGDCEDLASWRIAELRLTGIRAHPRITFRRFGPGGRFSLYHITLVYPDGRVEDPSRLLGMGQQHNDDDDEGDA